jgi:hypothetical protein
MGAKTWMLVYAEANAREALRTQPQLDREVTLRLAYRVHLSGEDGAGWTVLAVDRKTREWAVAQAETQLRAAKEVYERLYQRHPA